MGMNGVTNNGRMNPMQQDSSNGVFIEEGKVSVKDRLKMFNKNVQNAKNRTPATKPGNTSRPNSVKKTDVPQKAGAAGKAAHLVKPSFPLVKPSLATLVKFGFKEPPKEEVQAKSVGEDASKMSDNLKKNKPLADKPQTSNAMKEADEWVDEFNDGLAKQKDQMLDMKKGGWLDGMLNKLIKVREGLDFEMEAAYHKSFQEKTSGAGVKGKQMDPGKLRQTRKDAAYAAARQTIKGTRLLPWQSLTPAQLACLEAEGFEIYNGLYQAQKNYLAKLEAYVSSLCAKDGKEYADGVNKSRKALIIAQGELLSSLREVRKLDANSIDNLVSILKEQGTMDKDAAELLERVEQAETTDAKLSVLTGIKNVATYDPATIRRKILMLGTGKDAAAYDEKAKMLRRCRDAFRFPSVLKGVGVKLAEEMRPCALGGSVRKFLEPYADVASLRKAFGDYSDALARYAQTGFDSGLGNAEFSLGKQIADFGADFGRKDGLGGFVRRYAKDELSADEKTRVENDPELKEFLDACSAEKEEPLRSTFKAITGHDYLGFQKDSSHGDNRTAIQIVKRRIEQVIRADPENVKFLGREATRLSKKASDVPAPKDISAMTTLFAMGNAPGNISPLAGVQPDKGGTSREKGCFNEVVMVDIKGKTYVFKPELSGSIALKSSSAGKLANYEDGQSMTGLNIATRKMAEMVGCGDVVVNSMASVYDNRLALQMEKAEGLTAGSYFGDPPKGATEKPSFGACHALLKGLDVAPTDRSAKDLKQAGSLFRQATDLQWIDRLTGQLDRNMANYMVDFPANGDSVTLKGIDNDFSFPADQTSMKTYRMPINSFFYDLKKELNTDELKAKYGVGSPPQTSVGCLKWLKSLSEKVPGTGLVIRSGAGEYGWGEELLVDPEKCKLDAVRVVMSKMGYRSVSVPPVMSKGMATQLLKLGKMPPAELEKTVRQNLEGLVLGEKNVASAVSRLKEMIEIAKEYSNAKPPRVIPDDGWTDEGTAKLLMGDLKSTPLKGGEEGGFDRGKFLGANYAAREFYDLLKVFVPKDGEGQGTGGSAAV